MIGKIKGLGLAFAAIAAMSMAAASAVQAGEVHITSGGSTSIFGQQTTQQVKFTLTKTNQSVVCNQALFEGTIQGTGGSQTTKQDITITPTYTGCTFVGLTLQRHMNGCKYTINGAGHPALTATVSVVGCTQTDKKPFGEPGGSGVTKPIETTVTGGCVITRPEQNTIGGHVTFTNENPHATGALNAQFTLQGITYQVHNCAGFTTPTETRQDGDYVGTATFLARVDTGSEKATHNGHEYDKLIQNGAVVGIIAT